MTADGLKSYYEAGQSILVEGGQVRLFLGTPRQNSKDMVRKGRSARGQGHPMSKLMPQDVINIRKSQDKARQLAQKYGVSRRTISNIRNRDSWQHI